MASDVAYPNAQTTDRAFRTLTGFAEELRAATVRIMAYLCGLMMLTLIATDVMSRLYDEADMAPQLGVREVSWHPVDRPQPAFSAPNSVGYKSDLSDKTASYEILRHSEGGRKDLLRWTGADSAYPVAAIEIYRPGDELTGFGPATVAIADRTAPWRAGDVQAAGMIETKFGPAALVAFRMHATGETRPCTGFVQTFDAPLLQIIGWTCQGDMARSVDPSRVRHAQQAESWLAQRQSAACLLSRLTLLAAGSDPKLAEFFAHAELKRRASCGSEGIAAANTDWLSTAERPQLRGARQ